MSTLKANILPKGPGKILKYSLRQVLRNLQVFIGIVLKIYTFFFAIFFALISDILTHFSIALFLVTFSRNGGKTSLKKIIIKWFFRLALY